MLGLDDIKMEKENEKANIRERGGGGKINLFLVKFGKELIQNLYFLKIFPLFYLSGKFVA